MQNTWKPLAAGVLSIVAGSLSVAGGILVLLLGGVLSSVLAATGLPNLLSLVSIPVFGGLATPLLLVGALAIAGGTCSIKRRMWPLALAGAICALFPPHTGVLGILAIVFVVLGKEEFP